MSPIVRNLFSFGLAACLLLLTAGCSAKVVDTHAGLESPVVFPLPPDSPRIQWLYRIQGSYDVEGVRQASFFQRLAGTEEDQVGLPITKPYGVTSLPGLLYVCDTQLPGIARIDLVNKTFDYLQPAGAGALFAPVNCFADPETGYLYVTDSEPGQVKIYDPAGSFLYAIGEHPTNRPTGIFVDDNHIWVVDDAFRSVRIYDKASREFVRSFPDSLATGEARLTRPTNIFVHDGKAYVSDAFAANVKVYDTNGSYIRTVGRPGSAIGSFARPRGLTVDRDGILYVVDGVQNHVQLFNAQGQLLMGFGFMPDEIGGLHLPAQVIVDYENLEFYEQFVDPRFELKHLVLVTNQMGPHKVNVYGRVELRPGESVEP